MRGTRAHNTLSINGAEQNRLPDNLFSMSDETQTKVVDVTDAGLTAFHCGFQELERSDLTHSRIFKMEDDKSKLILTDRIDGVREGDRLSWMWHLAPGLSAEVQNRRVVVKKEEKVICRLGFQSELTVSTQEFPHSPSYGAGSGHGKSHWWERE